MQEHQWMEYWTISSVLSKQRLGGSCATQHGALIWITWDVSRVKVFTPFYRVIDYPLLTLENSIRRGKRSKHSVYCGMWVSMSVLFCLCRRWPILLLTFGLFYFFISNWQDKFFKDPLPVYNIVGTRRNPANSGCVQSTAPANKGAVT